MAIAQGITCKACGVVAPRPSLLPNPDAIESYLTWVAEALADGAINANVGKELNNAASKMLTAIKVREGLQEMDELRELVRQAKEAADRRAKNEVEDRYSTDVGNQGSYELVR